jgi:hypothetical protein
MENDEVKEWIENFLVEYEQAIDEETIEMLIKYFAKKKALSIIEDAGLKESD